MLLSELPTPQVLIDHSRAMNNIARVQVGRYIFISILRLLK